MFNCVELHAVLAAELVEEVKEKALAVVRELAVMLCAAVVVPVYV